MTTLVVAFWLAVGLVLRAALTRRARRSGVMHRPSTVASEDFATVFRRSSPPSVTSKGFRS